MKNNEVYLITNTPETSGVITQKEETFVCSFCGKEHPAYDKKHSQITFSNYESWFDEDKKEVKICFECSKDAWQRLLGKIPIGGKIDLYFSIFNNGSSNYGIISNFNGSFKKEYLNYRTSWHNIGGKRHDFWFSVNGNEFHGYQIGDYNQIAHCRRIKG